MAEQQRLREEKEAMERARAEQEESERLQRQVRDGLGVLYPSALVVDLLREGLS